MRRLIFAAVVLAAAALIVPQLVTGQAAWRLPVPGALTTGSLIYARDGNNLGAISAVASGQVLTSQGTGTAPAWSASPTFTTGTFTNLAVGADTVTNFFAISTSLTPSAISACGGGAGMHCATTQSFSPIVGLGANDRVFVNGPTYATYATSRCPMVGASVAGANSLRLHFARVTGASCTPQAGTYHIFAIRTS